MTNIKSFIKLAITFFALASSMTALVGCYGIPHKLSDEYPPQDLRSVIVLPISGYAKPDAKEVFRTMIGEALKERNFEIISDAVAEELYLKIGKKKFYSLLPAEMAKAMNVDMVMFCKVYYMEETNVMGLKALDLSAGYKLFDKNGELLWEVDYDTEESDFGFDGEMKEYAIIKVFEPRVQRLVSNAFTTLPPLPSRGVGTGESYFGWLP